MDIQKITHVQKSRLLSVIMTILLLIASGAAYRCTASEFHKIIGEPISLPIPLSEFPVKIGDIIGHDLEILEVTREYMVENFAVDYLGRRYVNINTNNWFDLYVVFCSSKPNGGHRPLICYKGRGRINDGMVTSQVITDENTRIPCHIHRFHKHYPDNNKIVILNFYDANGQITNDEGGFSSIWGRRPNISGDIVRYIAQVQISSNVESSIIAAAESISDQILQLMPKPQNIVSATAEK